MYYNYFVINLLLAFKKMEHSFLQLFLEMLWLILQCISLTWYTTLILRKVSIKFVVTDRKYIYICNFAFNVVGNVSSFWNICINDKKSIVTVKKKKPNCNSLKKRNKVDQLIKYFYNTGSIKGPRLRHSSFQFVSMYRWHKREED